MEIRLAEEYRCPVCRSVGLGEIKEGKIKEFTCRCGHQEVFE